MLSFTIAFRPVINTIRLEVEFSDIFRSVLLLKSATGGALWKRCS